MLRATSDCSKQPIKRVFTHRRLATTTTSSALIDFGRSIVEQLLTMEGGAGHRGGAIDEGHYEMQF
jgi:hypothetical protein